MFWQSIDSRWRKHSPSSTISFTFSKKNDVSSYNLVLDFSIQSTIMIIAMWDHNMTCAFEWENIIAAAASNYSHLLQFLQWMDSKCTITTVVVHFQSCGEFCWQSYNSYIQIIPLFCGVSYAIIERFSYSWNKLNRTTYYLVSIKR